MGRKKSRLKSGTNASKIMASLDQTERNALLDDNTLPYLFSDGDNRAHSISSETITNASLIFETQHTRWYHRCFKCNVAVNIAMLFAFIFLILMAPWY